MAFENPVPVSTIVDPPVVDVKDGFTADIAGNPIGAWNVKTSLAPLELLPIEVTTVRSTDPTEWLPVTTEI